MTRETIIRCSVAAARTIDSFSEWCGRTVSWLVLVMVLLVAYDVTMRYLFQSGSVAIQELEWHLFSIIFLLGAGYTLKHDTHVRLDVLYQSRFMNDHRRAWVNLLGGVLFLIPFCALIIVCSIPFISQAYVYGEGSPDPGGLSGRWLIKAAIPAGFALILVQGIGDVFRNLARILEPRR